VRRILRSAGFKRISITRKDNDIEVIRGWNFSGGVENMVFPGYIVAHKPSLKGDGNGS
jgi:hypothetical protein